MKENKPELILADVDANPDSAYIWHWKTEHHFPFHTHQKGQLTYVEGGAAFLYTRDKTYFLPARHYMWVPAGVEHYFQHRYPANFVRTIYFFMDEDDQNDPFYTQTGIYPVGNLLLEMILYTEKWDGGHVYPGSKGYRFVKAIKNILPDISSVPLPITLPTTENPRMQPVLRYIQENLSEPLTLESVGHAFNYSERTLTRLFRATMDISFFQYLKLARMIKAMGYLLETEKTISEIAWDTGYNSVSAFSNTFYKLVGKRPTDFQP
ncbi:helix-turn-helix transcriptional regulator [Chitinophaga nivalis]|uniref:AraC family transcriptional regulator n=1 Tax=Chitinophaga nivalis TaxID=2991709 RepID=A0ABT3IL16_9BACT|nr:AraC family transcriptional regulator [Chitinophaga nivalis]MCW3465666.1 AraC family transcriptional regulator [Chitinophaga nivalis]MCW3484643.1 AraC family transcriptional regulator [Chitinophaga nivalis]